MNTKRQGLVVRIIAGLIRCEAITARSGASISEGYLKDGNISNVINRLFDDYNADKVFEINSAIEALRKVSGDDE